MATPKQRAVDAASCEMFDIAAKNQHELAHDRYEKMLPQCGFGEMGICCRNCNMGPCRIDPFGDGAKEGVCGASAAVITARNLTRSAAVGASAHSDHGRDVTDTLLAMARGEAQGYSVKGVKKMHKLAAEWEIDTEGLSDEQIAEKIALVAFEEFGRQHGTGRFVSRAPQKQRERWDRLGVTPRGVDREVVTALHSTHMGASNEAKHLIHSCVRVGLADGWGGSMIATELSDILFGEPSPVRSETNLGVLKENMVNIVVHGHEPTLSDAIVAASQTDEVLELCKAAGAEGLQLAGICCTANEILMRHGIPVAGNFLQQEISILTGVVDMMIVDIQCIMPGISSVAKKFHTRIVSTSPKAKFEGMEHVEFDEAKAMDSAKELIELGIEAFKKRDKSQVHVPKDKTPLVAGFTVEGVFDHLGGRYRPSYRPLNNAIADGRIRGVVGIVGCNNVKETLDEQHLLMAKELMRHDILLLQTGCSAISCAKDGLLQPEAAALYAGRGLLEVCDAVGLPPSLHLGSCVDNSRILMACVEVCRQGGLSSDDIAELPVAGAAPEWMSEKAITIGFYFVGSGVLTVLNDPLPVTGSPWVTEYVTGGIEEDFGGKFAFEKDPIKAAQLMIEHIDKKREGLKLAPMLYEPRPMETLGKIWEPEEAEAVAK